MSMSTLSSSHVVRPTVLAYHELTAEEPAYRYALSCRKFEEHAQFAASSESRGQLVISFDDGHISNYANALPLLEKYSCKAIFFVIAGRIGAHKDFMTWTHLQELVRLGHSVQAHGWSHAFLTQCSDSELETELKRPRQVIEQRLGTKVEALSVPHGRWNRRVVKACAEEGYRRLYTSSPWTSRHAVNRVEIIGRLVMLRSMDAIQLSRWLSMSRAEAGLRRTGHAVKESARRILGSKLYYQLWARFSAWNGPEDTVLNVDQ